MTEELKPCQNCGQKASKKSYFNSGYVRFIFIQCDSCGIHTSGSKDETTELKIWNQRQPHPDIKAIYDRFHGSTLQWIRGSVEDQMWAAIKKAVEE